MISQLFKLSFLLLLSINIHSQVVKNVNGFSGTDTLEVKTSDISEFNISYNESIGRYELYVYRMSGMIISYALSYILRPGRIIRTIKSLFSASSSTVVEQRLKDLLN